MILLSQGSMAYAETFLSETYGIPVVSSPRFGAAAVRSALEEKGYRFERQGEMGC